MSFTNYKKSILSRQDNSNKGSIDKPVIPLITAINALNNYCTTSSCSGRIVIHDATAKKNEFKTLFSSHDKVQFAQIKQVLTDSLAIPANAELWFRFEPIILHVACDSLDSANNLLNLARPHFKHSGILSMNQRLNRYILEIRGSEFIEAPLALNNTLIVSDELLCILCASANKKLKETHKRMNNFMEMLEKR